MVFVLPFLPDYFKKSTNFTNKKYKKQMINEYIKSSENFKDFHLTIKKQIKKDKNLQTEISNQTNFLDKHYKNVELVQRTWHIWNNEEIVLCKFCKINPVKIYTATKQQLYKNLIYSKNCGSKQCIRENTVQTNIKRFGTDNPNNTIEIQNKIKQTNIKRYGVDNPFKSETIKQQIKETNLERYGVDNPAKSQIIKERIKETFIENYGVDNPLKSKKIREQIKQTNLKKYGETSFTKTDEYKKRVKETCLKKYGTTHPNKSKQIKNKIKQTNLKRYGTNTYCQSQEYKDEIIENINLQLNDLGYKILNFKNDRWDLECPTCKNNFEIERGLIKSRITYSKIPLCTHCIPKKSLSAGTFLLNSFIENELNLVTKKEDRDVLDGLEIDVLIPNKNIGFEFNGVYWHSEIYSEELYHQNKKLKGLEKNVNIIHIWEDDWNLKNDIVKSRIKNILGLNQTKIYGRQCKIKQIYNIQVVKDFLNKNHLQGYINSKWKYGLYLNDELVSMMTFGTRNKQTELLRFCNKLNTSVVGGFSKLFKHFLKEHNEINEITTYADFDWSMMDNNVYLKNGFKFEKLTKPGYFWASNDIRYYRQKFQKHKLVKEGFDKNKTEDQIMKERGFMKVYNSGNLKYKYIK